VSGIVANSIRSLGSSAVTSVNAKESVALPVKEAEVKDVTVVLR